MKTVFLDRDGVLTVEKGYIRRREELEIFPYAKSCITALHEKGYLAIVVTNQSGIARGYFSGMQMEEMNTYLIQETGVDAVYYCPHHEKGIVERYAIKCSCRKPETGMIRQACKDFDIDRQALNASYMVGDRASDIKLGQNAGVTSVLLESGYGTKRLEEEVKADLICKDLVEFVSML